MILHLDAAFVVALIVSTVIPLLSSLLARAHWPGEVVGILTLLLATANGFFAEWADAGTGFDWRAALGTAVLSFLTAVGARYGLWKGTITDAKALAFPEQPPTPAIATGYTIITKPSTPADPDQPAAGVPPEVTPGSASKLN